MILAEPFVVRSVIILRLSLPPVLWGGLTDELTDCCRSGATRAGELVVMDFFLCHGNFMRPKKKAAAPTAPPLHRTLHFQQRSACCEVMRSCFFPGRDADFMSCIRFF